MTSTGEEVLRELYAAIAFDEEGCVSASMMLRIADRDGYVIEPFECCGGYDHRGDCRHARKGIENARVDTRIHGTTQREETQPWSTAARVAEELLAALYRDRKKHGVRVYVQGTKADMDQRRVALNKIVRAHTHNEFTTSIVRLDAHARGGVNRLGVWEIRLVKALDTPA